MQKAKWIWYPGEYEIYHNLLLHSRRYERNVHIPCQWGLSTPYPNVEFMKEIHITSEQTITVYTTAPGVVCLYSDKTRGHRFFQKGTGTEITIEPGDYYICVQVQSPTGLPAIFIDNEQIWTDETWKATHLFHNIGDSDLPYAECTPVYEKATDDPQIFPFAYERWDPIAIRKVDGGTLYDFGRETFGKLHIENADPTKTITVRFGESETEALDCDPVIREVVSGKRSYTFPCFAYRYVCLLGTTGETVWTEYEYLPIEDKASFTCNIPEIEKIFEVCSHTFHLNSREFYLDGIKRDRWVWAGDAYQSFMVNNYLYFDQDITKRTIRALLGKPPYERHVNNISDYSLYLIISVWDYYYTTGDLSFVKSIYERLVDLYQFTVARLDGNGFIYDHPGDWIFIDWTNFDRNGPLCAEQILLWKAMVVLQQLSHLCEKEQVVSQEECNNLKHRINEYFWCEEKGAYIDSYTSGKKNVTRHANIFSVLYDFAPDKTARIVNNVLANDNIPAITTPYFKFFELMALCHIGDVITMQKMLMEYWYPMIQLGATSVWEQYDPNEKGREHYAMYGDPFGRSLCHAWGSGPIYLLGRYVAGVRATDVAYKTFAVEPNPGLFTSFTSTVPLFEGSVTIEFNAEEKTISVTTDLSGGVLNYKNNAVVLIAGERNTIHIT